jgi:hypothetical protein
MLGEASAAATAGTLVLSTDLNGGWQVADRVRTTKGVSLAKGPVGLVGLVALLYGVLALIFGNNNFTAHPFNGAVLGDTWLGIMGNGWTYALMAVGGLLLLLAAPMHWGAKTMALIVGLAFGAACVIGLIQGDNALGIFAENGWTKLAFGVAAAILLVLAMLPRVGRRRVEDDAYVGDRPVAGGRFGRRRDPALASPATTRDTTTTTTGSTTTRDRV